MTSQNKNLTGEPVSKEAQYYIDWALETYKNNISIIDGFLSHLVTLDLGLIALFFSFSESISLPGFTKIYFIPGMLIISLAFGIYGIFPRISKIDLRRPHQIKIYKENTQKRKYRYLFLSFIFLLMAMIVGLIYFFVQNYK